MRRYLGRPGIDRQLEVLEERFVASVLALEDDEREKLLSWVPVIRDTIETAEQDAEMLTAKLVGAERFSQISPTDPSNENRSGGGTAS